MALGEAGQLVRRAAAADEERAAHRRVRLGVGAGGDERGEGGVGVAAVGIDAEREARRLLGRLGPRRHPVGVVERGGDVVEQPLRRRRAHRERFGRDERVGVAPAHEGAEDAVDVRALHAVLAERDRLVQRRVVRRAQVERLVRADAQYRARLEVGARQVGELAEVVVEERRVAHHAVHELGGVAAAARR